MFSSLRLYAYAAIAIVALGGAWWLHNHLVDKGVQQQREADAKAYAKLQRDVDLETGRLKGRAEAAEKAHAEEHDANAQYRAEHPIHGSLRNAVCNRPAVPNTGSSDSINGGTSAESGPVFDVPKADNREPDQLGMLDILAARCDEVSSQLREYQSR